MSSVSPIALLVDASGNQVGIILDGAVYRLQTVGKALNAAGTQINPATEDTLALIKSTDGIKKITDPVAVTDNGGSLTVDGPLTDTELRAAAVPVSAAALPLPAGAATEATLATMATEAKLEAVRALLATIDADTSTLAAVDFATQTTLATLATEAKLEAVRALLQTIDVDTSNLDVLLSTRATEATLAAADGRLATIDAVLDGIKDSDGIKKITDQLPAGTNEVGKVAQGTKAAGADAWPVIEVDGSGNQATITPDAGVYRREISGKVTVVGALPPPATTPVQINADTPLTVGAHDTSFVIASGEMFHLQNMICGNEDPTKGAVTTVIFDDGTEHVVARIYTAGRTVNIGFADVSEARDGTALLGNGSHEIIVRRAKYAGTDVAIDAVVSGYSS